MLATRVLPVLFNTVSYHLLCVLRSNKAIAPQLMTLMVRAREVQF